MGHVASQLLHDSSVEGIVVDGRDVTERKEVEEALRQSEARYRAVLEQTTENIYLVDVSTKRILEANAAALDTLGYAAEELERLTLYDVVDHDREWVDHTIRRVMEEEKRSRIGEQRYRRKDGSLVDAEVYAEPYTAAASRSCVSSPVTLRGANERRRASGAASACCSPCERPDRFLAQLWRLKR